MRFGRRNLPFFRRPSPIVRATAGGGGAVDDPSAIFGADLLAWFRGDAVVTSGTDVTTATDKTGNGYHFTAVASAEPQLVTAFGQPCFDFDGTGQRFTADHRATLGAGLVAPWGQCVIAKVRTATNNAYMMNNTNGSTHVQTMDGSGRPKFRAVTGTSDMRAALTVFLVYDDGTDSYIYANGVLETTLTGSTGNPGASLWSFGARGDGVAPSDMQVPESFYLNGAITAGQIADLQTYAEDRYTGF